MSNKFQYPEEEDSGARQRFVPWLVRADVTAASVDRDGPLLVGPDEPNTAAFGYNVMTSICRLHEEQPVVLVLEDVPGPPEEENPVREINRARLHLLARRFAEKSLTPEQAARLEILTEKVKMMMPRVTKEDFERVAEMATRLQDSEGRVEQILKRVRIKDES